MNGNGNLIMFIINLVSMAMVSFLMAILPQITRKTLLFGVRIPEEATQQAEVLALRKQYLTRVLLSVSAINLAAIVQYLLWPSWTALGTLYFPLALILAQFFNYVPHWKSALALKAANGWSVQSVTVTETKSAAAREKYKGFPFGWYIATGLLLLVAIGLSLAVYPQVPDRIPTHFDYRMMPDAWADKSVLSVMMMPLTTLGMASLMFLGGLMMWRMKLQINADNPARSFAQHRIYRRMVGNAMGIMTLSISLATLLLQPAILSLWTPSGTLTIWVFLLLIILGSVPVLYVSVTAGQGGYKLEPPPEAYEQASPLSTAPRLSPSGDDRYWLFGMFYYNREDPTLFIEDRFGINGGFNYARRLPQAIVGVLALLTIGLYIWLTALFIQGGISW